MSIGTTHRDSQAISLKHPAKTSLKIKERAAKSKRHAVSITGKLVMVDFKESHPRFRIEPQVGKPVRCRFDNSFRNKVQDNILKFVRVEGEAIRNDRDIITDLKVSKIELVDMGSNSQDTDGGQREPAETSFWRHDTVEELAAKQRVNPVTDLKLLQGTWPGEDEDGFEEWIDELRASQMIGGGAASHG